MKYWRLETWRFQILEIWNIGDTKYWRYKISEIQNIGDTRYWRYEILEIWYIGDMRYWSFEILEILDIGDAIYCRYKILDKYLKGKRLVLKLSLSWLEIRDVGDTIDWRYEIYWKKRISISIISWFKYHFHKIFCTTCFISFVILGPNMFVPIVHVGRHSYGTRVSLGTCGTSPFIQNIYI